jgi:protein arginine N-methyltransferase 1
VVLDIGCGTGILSMFAARAGAKRVIGIDAADIIDKAREIIKANGLSDVITLIKSKVEEAVLPVETVDLVVSEWMGYFLLYESMLPSVLLARDKWCVPGGGIYPNKARMLLAGADLSANRVERDDFWKDVYGFDMSCLVDGSEKLGDTGCTVEEVRQADLITEHCTIKDLDMQTVTVPELEFATDFELTFEEDRTLDSFVVWFDTTFDYKCNTSTVLSTAPTSETTPLTHWSHPFCPPLSSLSFSVSLRQV